MSAKLKRSSGNIRKTSSDNILPKRSATASKEFKGAVNESEFSYNFRKFCIECNASVVPNVKVVFSDDMRENTTVSCSNVSKGSDNSSDKQRVEQKEIDDALSSIPEILAIQDDTTTAIIEVIFKNFQVDRNMLVALTKTLKSGTFLRTLKLQFCYLSSQEIASLHLILGIVDTITEVSVDGNPNKYQNFYLLLKDTKLLNLSLRFCAIDKNGAKKIADRINTFAPQTLVRLNLSSNFLGDEGVALIADALRANRTLLILNLADNQITDRGCEKLAQVLQMFPLNEAEVKSRRKRIFAYLKRKQELMEMYSMIKTKSTLSASSFSKKSRDSLRKSQLEQHKKERSQIKCAVSVSSAKMGSLKSKSHSARSEFERMEFVGESILSPDSHPFVKSTISVNRELYCSGNNKLMSLNLAYNKITQVGLRMLHEMLEYQDSNFAMPDYGILRIILEGNVAPNCCSEMNEIMGLITQKNEANAHGSLGSRKKSATSCQ